MVLSALKKRRDERKQERNAQMMGVGKEKRITTGKDWEMEVDGSGQPTVCQHGLLDYQNRRPAERFIPDVFATGGTKVSGKK
jgi:hypothetical protein